MNTCICEKCASVRFSAHVIEYKKHLRFLRLNKFYAEMRNEFSQLRSCL